MDKIGDVLIMNGKAYVSLEMYQSLQEDLKRENDLCESFLDRLTSIEVANGNGKK